MNKVGRFTVYAQKNARSLRALFVLVTMGLLAIGAGAPGGGWDGP